MLRCSCDGHEPFEVVCGGVNLLPEELAPMGTWFWRVVDVELLLLDDDELPPDDDPPEDWLPVEDPTVGACCCTTGAGM